ncbi:MAG: VOC family protein [Myxococcota bacterium]|nr:VOC family protein [Myxococcota bacterium]
MIDEKKQKTPALAIGPMANVIVPVTDQDRAIAFYVEKLGFEKRADVPFGNGDRWVEVAPPGSQAAISLAPPRHALPTGSNPTCISFEVDDVDATHAILRARGVDVDPEVLRAPPPVPPMFFLRDPDRNALLIVARR